MFTISPEGLVSWDGWQFGPSTTARQFRQTFQTASTNNVPLPRAVHYEARAAPDRLNPNLSFLLQFKKKEKLRISFPDTALDFGGDQRAISGSVVFCDDFPDVLTVILKPAYENYSQVNLTEVTVREHAILNAWVQAIFGTPSSTSPVQGYQATLLRYELPWGILTTAFETAGERANEPGTSVMRIEYRNPSPDSALNFTQRYRELSQQYDDLQKARREPRKRARQSGRTKMIGGMALLVIALLVTLSVHSMPNTEWFAIVQQLSAVIGVALFAWGFVERRGSR